MTVECRVINYNLIGLQPMKTRTELDVTRWRSWNKYEIFYEYHPLIINLNLTRALIDDVMSTHQDRCSAKQSNNRWWCFDAKQEWQFARRVEVLQTRAPKVNTRIHVLLACLLSRDQNSFLPVTLQESIFTLRHIYPTTWGVIRNQRSKIHRSRSPSSFIPLAPFHKNFLKI